LIFNNKQKSAIYITTHDESAFDIFYNLRNRLEKITYIEKVYLRKRSLVKERLGLETIKDMAEYKELKNYLEASNLYNFAWGNYSLYTISSYLYKKSKRAIFVEDGSHQSVNPKPSNLNLAIKKYIYGVSTEFYEDKKLEKILVQFPEKYPKHLQPKLEKLNTEKLFRSLSKEETAEIVKVFMSEDEVKNLLDVNTKGTVVILTQPLSEDGFVTESEKKKLYKDIIDSNREYNIIIKKHPREKTIYKFDNVAEISGSFPSEILTLLGIKFRKAIGICTSAVTLIDAEERINTDEEFLKRHK
jgi:alpha-L-fucosidase